MMHSSMKTTPHRASCASCPARVAHTHELAAFHIHLSQEASSGLLRQVR